MPRSPLTLAASVTAALPRAGVVGARVLSERSAGRYDTIVATLDDGRQVVARVGADPDAESELIAHARALQALTPGVRELLPFQAPRVLGEATIDDARLFVVDYLPGYRLNAADVPAGHGAATALGAAIAAVHALPTSVVHTQGLPARTSEQVRDDVSRLLDRVDATRRAPGELVARWRRAVSDDELWRFESAVTLGGVAVEAFVFADDDVRGPVVTSLRDWHGLSVGDPAVDLRWTSSAPLAADGVHEGYLLAADRAADAGLRERARLHAELEFAQWLVHGFDTGRDDIVDDAAALLSSLADGVRGDELGGSSPLDLDDALALLDRTPAPDLAAVDTSMQTDAYDPRMLDGYLDDAPEGDDPGDSAAPSSEAEPEGEHAPPSDTPTSASSLAETAPIEPFDPNATAPLDLTAPGLPDQHELDHETDHRAAERAALQRWTRSDSE